LPVPVAVALPAAVAVPWITGWELTLQLKVPASLSLTLRFGATNAVGDPSSDMFTVAVLPVIPGTVQLIVKFNIEPVTVAPPLVTLAR